MGLESGGIAGVADVGAWVADAVWVGIVDMLQTQQAVSLLVLGSAMNLFTFQTRLAEVFVLSCWHGVCMNTEP